jgi:hypothetical protein
MTLRIHMGMSLMQLNLCLNMFNAIKFEISTASNFFLFILMQLLENSFNSINAIKE